MKKPFTLLLTVCLCLLAILLIPLKKTFHFSFEKEQGEFEEKESEKETGVDKQLEMWFQARAYPDPYYLNDKYLNAWNQAQALRNQQVSSRANRMLSGGWNSIGPSSGIGGRILSIAIDPTNSNNLFAGSASGGIWKSTNGGTLWSQVSTGFPALGVTSIIIDATGKNIYAGTGEVYRIDSTSGTPNPGNTGYSVWKTRGSYGIGILKSTDGGVTWSQKLNKTTSQLFGIENLRFDPANSNTIYACATDGLYQSTDAGTTWTKIFSVTYVSDVVIQGSTLVAAVGNLQNSKKGIYKSTNGGTSWTLISSGLPASFQGFIKFGYVSSNINTIIASIGVSEASGVKELYRSTDFGSTWTALSNSTHTQWQYWCAHTVAINPFYTDSIAFGGVNGYTFKVSTAGLSSAFSIHSDIHDLKYDPSIRGTIYVCCDGGIYKSTDGGNSFNLIDNGLNATQFYAPLGVSAQDANLIVGGLQDNGVYKTTNGGTSWSVMPGNYGDGSGCVIDPTNDNNILSSGDARNVYLSTNRGSTATNKLSYLGGANDSRTAFASPLAISKSNPLYMYAGSDNLHVSTNGGSSWNITGTGTNYIDAIHKPAITLAVSPTNPKKVYASTSNFAQYDNDVDNLYLTGNPNVQKTTTGNTPFTSIMGTGSNILPNRFVMDFAISPTFDDSVFAAVGGFGTQHIYVTGDGGTNWSATGLGLPDAPFNAILIDPINPKVIYAGGDMGMYVSPNRGVTWYDYNNGFSDNIAMVMDIQPSADGQLIVATHGKGIFKGPRYSGILPVTNLSFAGKSVSASNELQWQVAQEINVSRYELERSIDGNSYQKIETTLANGSSVYSYTDVISTNLSYYYRLKTINRDGSYQYSNVVYLKRNAKGTMQVMGNPFTNNIQIQFSIPQNSNATINLYDAGGKLLRSEQIVASGQFTHTINNLGSLPSGMYFIEAIVNDQKWRQRLIKK